MAVRDAIVHSDRLWRPVNAEEGRTLLRGLAGGDSEVNRALEQMLMPNAVINGDDEGGWDGGWSVGGSNAGAAATASGLGLGSPRSMLLSLAPSSSNSLWRGSSPVESSPQADAQRQGAVAGSSNSCQPSPSGKLSRLGSCR